MGDPHYKKKNMNGGEAHIVSTVYLYTTIWSRKKRGSFTPRTYFSLVHFTIQLKANNEDFLSFIPLWYTYTSEDLPNVSGFTNVLSVKIGLGRELVNPIYHHLPVKGVNLQTPLLINQLMGKGHPSAWVCLNPVGD